MILCHSAAISVCFTVITIRPKTCGTALNLKLSKAKNNDYEKTQLPTISDKSLTLQFTKEVNIFLSA